MSDLMNEPRESSPPDVAAYISSYATPAEIERIHQTANRIRQQVAQVIVGKAEVVEMLLAALFSEGHILLEDVPGIGKTTLAKTLARTLGCSFSRIQFTPDLLPSDIVGVNMFNQRDSVFEYRAGPIMAQVVLADEINRAGPRTQSALLEAMEERQVTVDGVTRALPYPFLVLATQNPVELEGTFPLPEAQVDRFLMRLGLGYPERDEERQILHRFRTHHPLQTVEPVVSAAEIQAANQICRQVYVHPAVEDYLLDLVSASRQEPKIELGVSPRGTLALYRAGQALAAIRGRTYVIPDDLKQLAAPVLAHRLVLRPDARLHGRTPAEVITGLLEQTTVPVEETWRESVPA
jgi:MoxR-like ATPase